MSPLCGCTSSQISSVHLTMSKRAFRGACPCGDLPRLAVEALPLSCSSGEAERPRGEDTIFATEFVERSCRELTRLLLTLNDMCLPFRVVSASPRFASVEKGGRTALAAFSAGAMPCPATVEARFIPLVCAVASEPSLSPLALRVRGELTFFSCAARCHMSRSIVTLASCCSRARGPRRRPYWSCSGR